MIRSLVASPPLDESELRLRAAMVSAGVWLTYAACAALTPFLALTWHRPNRGTMAILVGIAILGGVGVSRVPRNALLRSRHRETFFLVWSALDVALIALLAALDGGATSPIAFVFFLTIVFAALSYPLRSVVIVGALNLGAFLLLALAASHGAHVNFAYVWLLASCLALTSLMCLWHARLHDVQRRDLARASRTDPLTGSLNRRGIEELLDGTIAAAKPGERFGWLVLDVDRFKEVNDNHGHAAGDELLCWIVSCATAVLRPQDSIGRIGGDEFAILLPGVGPDEARSLAERLHRRHAERTAVTIGVACYPDDAETRGRLQQLADANLYATRRERAGYAGMPRSSAPFTLASSELSR